MTSSSLFPPTPKSQNGSHIASLQQYEQTYAESIANPAAFWAKMAKENFHWEKLWEDDAKVLDYNFDLNKGDVSIKWFEGAKTNLCYNCLDRHLPARAAQVAYYYEGNDESDKHQAFTYQDLFEQVSALANVLKKHGVKKGHTVSIYLPMIVQLPVALLACARIGAIHSVIFGGFSAESLANRILDAKSRVMITADAVYRGTKVIHLKKEVDAAIKLCEDANFLVDHTIVVNRLNQKVNWYERDIWYHDEIASVPKTCPVEWVDAEDPLFMLYTSGSTGKPKGLLHTTGGYMVYAAITHKYVFDYHPGDVYWCTADVGWVTGHSYVVYGPLCNGATSVLFEGVATHPNNSRLWHLVDKYKVTQFYTAPTLLRAMMRFGEGPVKQASRASLRVLGSVGEPINPEAWIWYHKEIGNGQCSIVDTYWQTETGGIMITPLPGAIVQKPGSATFPFFGIVPAVVSENGTVLEGECEGFLVFQKPWPGQARSIFGDHKRFEATYYTLFKGNYVTGDGCRRDKDGYYWLTGRIDDVLNVSGHRLGTAEIESAFVSHLSVAEAAVVPVDHHLKGQGIYCYVTVKQGVETNDKLKHELVHAVRKSIGAIATPDVIHWASALPKTRSGKIMRRILRKIAEGNADQLGDISTLADKHVIEELIATRPQFEH